MIARLGKSKEFPKKKRKDREGTLSGLFSDSSGVLGPNQGVPNHPPNRLVFKLPFFGGKKSRMVLQKDGVRQGNYLLLKGGFCPPRFLLPQQALLLQSWRWGDVGHVFLCYGLDGHQDPQLLQTLESVGIAVGGCVLFHSVVLHCDSVVVRGFPFGFTAALQIFGVDFFLFFATLKNASKRTFWVRYVLGPGFLAAPLSASPIFVAFCELEIRYVLGPRDFLCFLGLSFLFFDGVKNLIWGVGKKCGKGNEKLVVRNHDDGRQLGHSHFSVQTHLKEIASGIQKSNNNSMDAHKM